MDPQAYYSNSEIKKELVFNAQNREVAVRFGNGGFGKRPDILQFDNEVTDFVKKGATSFHISEEHWRNPLDLKPGMTKRELDNLRTGWDLVLDIDSPDLEDSKIITHYLIEAIRFHDVKNISVKFSGNKGFHIAIPFKAFPARVNDVETVKLFPEGPKVIAQYLVNMIEPVLVEKYGEQMREKLKVDTVLISNRHMFRAPYSLHEKSGLVSLPIKAEEVLSFNKESAKPERVKASLRFMDDSDVQQGEASSLITQAFDWNARNSSKIEDYYEDIPNLKPQEFEEISEAIPEEYFPPCIKMGLAGIEDGRKRFLFILINFLRSVGWNMKEIEERVWKWNNSLENPLKEGYVMSQLNWHKANKKKVLPPNYANKAYYADIGILPPENITSKFKNPVTYTIRMFRAKNKRKNKKKSS